MIKKGDFLEKENKQLKPTNVWSTHVTTVLVASTIFSEVLVFGLTDRSAEKSQTN